TLAAIVRDLEKVPGLARLRLGSVEPNDLTPALLDALTTSRIFCPHLHLPLQSGEDATLARMRRPYRAADYAALLDKLRAAIPGMAISTDLLVGFPGETEEQFAASLAFAAEMRFSRLHVFPYSRRPGTPAASFPGQLPRPVREERGRRAAALAERLALEFNRTLVGRTLEVLVEEWQGGTAAGLAGEYVTVRFPSAEDLRNRIVRVVGETAAADGVAGRPR
ncbi:MAG: radical SAM protein, partial [Bacteroidota bacterium]